MKGKDIEMRSNRKVSLTSEHSELWFSEATAIDYGMIVLCREGEATIGVNFLEWRLKKGSVITLFPNDVVAVTNRTDDFGVEILKYGASLLREASLQLEQTVYSQLKTDRCRTESPILTNIINNMFALLRLYFEQEGSICLEQLVTLQLKAFFSASTTTFTATPKKRRPKLAAHESANCSTDS